MDVAPVHALPAALLLSLLGPLDQASAQASRLNATVIWAREQRVYVATADSGALAPGDILTFVFRGKRMAAGEVLRVFDGELAAAKLTSGSLGTAKRLDRLLILAERPSLRPAGLLRVGFPAPNRSTLVFACGEMALRPPLPQGVYRTDQPTERSYRLVRDPATMVQVPWPETLLIRLFDDPADQEIALERGELDAAVFWPGELSAHIREQPRWQGLPLGTRARGAVAAIELGSRAPDDSSTLALPDSPVLASLNEELFRGDLAPFETEVRPARSASSSRRPPTVRYEVDPSCPGRHVLERFLNRGRASEGAGNGARLVRVFYLDAPVLSPDSLFLGVAVYIRNGDFPPELRARADTLEAHVRRFAVAPDPIAFHRSRIYLRDSLQVALLYALGCPVVCAPELRRYVSAIGTDALVNLLDCRPGGRGP